MQDRPDARAQASGGTTGRGRYGRCAPGAGVLRPSIHGSALSSTRMRSAPGTAAAGSWHYNTGWAEGRTLRTGNGYRVMVGKGGKRRAEAAVSIAALGEDEGGFRSSEPLRKGGGRAGVGGGGHRGDLNARGGGRGGDAFHQRLSRQDGIYRARRRAAHQGRCVRHEARARSPGLGDRPAARHHQGRRVIARRVAEAHDGIGKAHVDNNAGLRATIPPKRA